MDSIAITLQSKGSQKWEWTLDAGQVFEIVNMANTGPPTSIDFDLPQKVIHRTNLCDLVIAGSLN